MLDAIINFLQWIGFTKQTIILLIVFGLGGWIFLSKQFNGITNKFTKQLNPIKLAIVEIQTLFRDMGKTIQHSLTETSDSPVKPSEFGWKLIKESGIDKIIEEDKVLFLIALGEELKGVDDITAYDVQERARNVIINLKNRSTIKPVKEYAYNNAIEIEVILRLGGLLLRDIYLKEHPEITSK